MRKQLFRYTAWKKVLGFCLILTSLAICLVAGLAPRPVSVVRTTSPLKSPHALDNSCRRVFVGGLTSVDSAFLKCSLEEKFGPVKQVDIKGQNSASTQPYAFVDFEDSKDANRAFSCRDIGDCYQEIKPANDIVPIKRGKSAARKRRSEEEYQAQLLLATTSRVLLQVDTSHLERVVELLNERGLEVTGWTTVSSVAIVGVSEDASTVHKILQQCARSIPTIDSVIRKLYYVNPEMATGVFDMNLCCQLLRSLQNTGDVKLNTFPPKVGRELVQSIKTFDEELLEKLATKDFSYTLSVVRVSGNRHDHQVWSVGIAPAPPSWATSASKAVEDSPICRAQGKLHEAFSRYQYPLPSSERRELVAIDCGSAPGGWSLFLATNPYFRCRRIYSVDPGCLDNEVLKCTQVEHLPMKAEDALAIVLEQEASRVPSTESRLVDIWVSDMCLHEMSDQVALMLRARQTNVLGTGSFFVLTLKCTKGHSKESFDSQVATETRRLTGHAYDLETIHLFSNRGGERTVLGFLK